MLRDIWYLILQDCRDIWHAVKELFKRDDYLTEEVKAVKVCSQCKVEKPLDAFKKNTKMSQGVHHICKDCDNANQRERYAVKGRKCRKGIKQKRRGYVYKRAQSLKDYIEHGYIPVTETGCWLWTRTIMNGGYGRAHFNKQKNSAHRLSWEFHYGPIPEGLSVLHKCDVPSCINPQHLFLGTHADNMLDKVKKGRAAHTKLTVSDILSIRAQYLTVPTSKLALEYNVSEILVYRVGQRLCWKHV